MLSKYTIYNMYVIQVTSLSSLYYMVLDLLFFSIVFFQQHCFDNRPISDN